MKIGSVCKNIFSSFTFFSFFSFNFDYSFNRVPTSVERGGGGCMVPKVFISMLPRSCSGAIIKHRTISTTLKEVYGSCYRERNFAGAFITLLCLSWRTVDNGDQR